MLSKSEIGIRNTLLIHEGKLLVLQNEGYNTLWSATFSLLSLHLQWSYPLICTKMMFISSNTNVYFKLLNRAPGCALASQFTVWKMKHEKNVSFTEVLMMNVEQIDVQCYDIRYEVKTFALCRAWLGNDHGSAWFSCWSLEAGLSWIHTPHIPFFIFLRCWFSHCCKRNLVVVVVCTLHDWWVTSVVTEANLETHPPGLRGAIFCPPTKTFCLTVLSHGSSHMGK